LPYFPRASDAILETLFGITRDQGRHEATFDLLIEIPYAKASIQAVEYQEDDGLSVLVEEGAEGSSVGHSLHATWKLHQNDRGLARATRELAEPGHLQFQVQAPPYFVSVGLVDPDGFLVDSAEAYEVVEHPAMAAPLPPQALPEALDHLDPVWRNAFNEWLFVHPHMTEVSGLALPVQSRADFESRLSYLADVLKSARVPDGLLDARSAEELPRDASLGRLKAVLRARLSAEDLDEAIAAVAILSNVTRLRVALQHSDAEGLPAAMARLGLEPSQDWTNSWELLRHRILGGLTDLRRAVSVLVDRQAT
jgi:hypothetical protein